MNSFSLKLVAILTMLIDHIGLYFFPEIPILKIVGRLSYPIIAFLLANGARYTKNINLYLLRLLLFAIVTQPIYLLVNRQNNPDFWQLNILFTLFLGLASIVLIRKTHNRLYRFAIIAFVAIFASTIKTEYEAMGVLSILSFYFYANNFKLLFFQQLFLYILYPTFFYPAILLNSRVFLDTLRANTQSFAILSMPFIGLYNKKQGPKLQYLFYIFYPAHLALIYIIKQFF